jgi:hypothetical protein
MAANLIVTNEMALNRAAILQTALAGSVLRLLQNFSPSPTTNRAVLEANEANFTGYPAGGYNLTAWTGPALPGTGGAAITSPSVIVAPNVANNVTNNLSGFWIESTGNTPLTYLAASFTPVIPVLVPTDQFPIIVQDIEGVSA